MKPKENKSLIDYSKRLKQAKDNLVAQMGTDIIGGFVRNTTEYKDTTTDNARRDIKMSCFNEWMAYLLLTNSEQTKYASLTNGLVSQYSMKNNQYPKSIIAATDIMKNHCHDDLGKLREKGKKKYKEKEKEKPDEEEEPL